jgi:hypothetical protein
MLVASMDFWEGAVVVVALATPLGAAFFYSLTRAAVRLGVLQALREFNQEVMQRQTEPPTGGFPVVPLGPREQGGKP